MNEEQEYLRSIWWVAWLSVWGALVAYLRETVNTGPSAIRADNAIWWFFRLIVEIMTSVTAGFLTYLLCDYQDLDFRLTMCAVALAGHFGTRTLFLMWNRLIERS